MMSIQQMRETVLNVFFKQDFYSGRILVVNHFAKSDFTKYDIGIFLFWCGVVDFFGGLYGVGTNGDVASRDSAGRVLKLSNGRTFKKFIERFFVDGQRSEELSSIIYNVFRNGMAHQLSPKKAGIGWIDSEYLIYYPAAGEAVHLNVKYFAKLSYEAFVRLRGVVDGSNPENDNSDAIVTNIYEKILKAPNGDGLGDDRAIDNELSHLQIINYTIPIVS
ncbi:MAG: hypothetical protein QM802_02515 [Agriterribacter sp.]